MSRVLAARPSVTVRRTTTLDVIRDPSIEGHPTVTLIGADPAVDGLSTLVAQSATSGFRAHLDRLVPGFRGSVLHQSLDDVPHMAAAVTG